MDRFAACLVPPHCVPVSLITQPLLPDFVLPTSLLFQFDIKSSLTALLAFTLAFLTWLFSFLLVLVFLFLCIIYLFLEKGEGKEKGRERNINVWLPLACSKLGTWPTTQACALTGNRISDLSVLRPALNPLSHTSQGLPVHSLLVKVKHQHGN